MLIKEVELTKTLSTKKEKKKQLKLAKAFIVVQTIIFVGPISSFKYLLLYIRPNTILFLLINLKSNTLLQIYTLITSCNYSSSHGLNENLHHIFTSFCYLVKHKPRSSQPFANNHTTQFATTNIAFNSNNIATFAFYSNIAFSPNNIATFAFNANIASTSR